MNGHRDSRAGDSDQDIARDQVNVLSVAEGFFKSSLLFALLRLHIFERIEEGAVSVVQLAREVGAQPETLGRLLRAAVALKILESRHGETFGVAGPFRSVLLPSAGTGYLGDWLQNLEYFRDALSRLDQAVLTSSPIAEFLEDASGGQEHTRHSRWRCTTTPR